MENRHDMPLSSLLLFLFPSILISISRIPSNRRSFTLPLFTHFILRISQRFRSIDITQLLSFSHLSLFIPISPLFESLFSKSIPIVVPIFLPFFSLYLEFLFSKDSYLIISPLFSYSLPLSISTSVLSFLSFKDSVQRYRFFSLSPFLPFLLFSLSRSTFSFVSFKDSLFLSFFVQSSIQNHVLPLSLLFSFHIYLFQLCPLLHDRSTLKIHVFPYEFLPLPFRGQFRRLRKSKPFNPSIYPISIPFSPPSISFHPLLFLFSFPFSSSFEVSGGTAKKTCRSINFGTRHFVFSFHPSGVCALFFSLPLLFSPPLCNLRSTARPTRPTPSPPSLVTSTTTIDSFHGGTEKRLAPYRQIHRGLSFHEILRVSVKRGDARSLHLLMRNTIPALPPRQFMAIYGSFFPGLGGGGTGLARHGEFCG